jgi:plasmid stabilization system protein ParE
LSYTFRVSRRAASQIRDAAEWWMRERPKAPEAFSDDLESAFALVRELPNAGEPVRHQKITGLRRILLGRVQFHLYYRVESGSSVVEVLTLWHTSRENDPRI